MPNLTPEFLCRGDNFCLFIYSKNFQILRIVILFVLLLLVIGITGFIIKLFIKKLKTESIDDVTKQHIGKKGIRTGILNLIFTAITWVILGFLYTIGPSAQSFLSSEMVIIFLFPVIASILEILFSLRMNQNSKVSRIVLLICWAISISFFVVAVSIILGTLTGPIGVALVLIITSIIYLGNRRKRIT